MSKGSNTPNQGEFARPAVEIPNKEVIGLAQTPTQAPLLQQANKRGMAELKLPVIELHTDFILFILFKLKIIGTLSFDKQLGK